MESFLGLTLNEVNDPDVARVPLSGLRLSDDDETEIMDIDDPENDDLDIGLNKLDDIEIDTSKLEDSRIGDMVKLENINIDKEESFNVGEQRLNDIQIKILNSQNSPEILKVVDYNEQEHLINTSKMQKILDGISLAGKQVFSPTQLGAGFAKKTSTRPIRFEHPVQEEQDDVYSETPLKSKSMRENSNRALLEERSSSNSYKNNLHSIRNRFENSQSMDNTIEDTDMVEPDSPLVKLYDDVSYLEESSPTKTKTPRFNGFGTPAGGQIKWGETPVNVQLHNHYHYHAKDNHYSKHYGLIQTSTPFLEKTKLDDLPDSSDTLPPPWSKINKARASRPYTIASYFQLLLNIATTICVLIIGYTALNSIRLEILTKLNESSAELLMEAALCAKQYEKNNCDPENMVPALERQCFEWAKCMNKKPASNTYHASISAQTLGVIINNLVEPIGIKAVLVFLSALAIWVFGSNFFFWLHKGKILL